MSKAVPSKPPIRPFRPNYALTTATRVPGRRTTPILPDQTQPSPATTDGSDGVLA